jgi:hypothetical protein
MAYEIPDQAGNARYVRAVPDAPRGGAQPGFPHSERTGFSHSTIARDAHVYGDRPNLRDFDSLMAAYMWSGGLARHQEVSLRLQESYGGTPTTLDRLLNSHAVFAFDWRGSLWLPMFQFQQPGMAVKPVARRVLAELGGVFDGWSLAVWYLQQNIWLADRRPLDLIDNNPPAVLAAARGDRFIATDSLQRLQ